MNNTNGYEPPDDIVNSNLAFSLLLTTLASALTGIVLLPVVLLKSLRSQPYQLLLSNYLSSSLAIVLGSGLYRTVQIVRYLIVDYDKAAKKANCIVGSFFEFPYAVSSYSLFFVALERYIFLSFNFTRRIDIYTTIAFISIPWAIGITRNSVVLADNSSRYRNIPYLGLCVDITSERDGRRIIHLIFDIVIPILLTIIILSLNYGKAFSIYKVIQAKLSYEREEEYSQLIEKKKHLMKVMKDLGIVVVFYVIRILAIIIITTLFRESANEDNSNQQRDSAATAAMILLLFEPSVISVIFALLNDEVYRETYKYFQSVLGGRATQRSTLREDTSNDD